MRASRHVLSALLLASFALACASTPAALRQIARPADAASIASLCEVVLREPETRRGSEALGELLEAWTRVRSASPAPPCGERLSFAPAEPGGFSPDDFDALAPAARFEVRDLPRHLREGAGVALVGVRRNRQRDALERHAPPEAIARAVTALAERVPGVAPRVRVRLLSPLAHEEALVGGARVPLAADLTAPFAALLGRTAALSRSWIAGLFAETPPRDAQLYLMEPYDPRKTPVLMIHGLASTPLTFAPLTNAIWGDAALRRTHQVWHFLYPTSAPFLYSARLLRNRLDDVRAAIAAEGLGAPPPMVVVAHSMGGLIAKTLITDSSETAWGTVFSRPPEALRGDAADVAVVRDILHWRARADVERVVFLAVPHRGSALARGAAGRLGDALAETPPELAAVYARLDAANPGALTPAFQRSLSRGELTSIDTLAPQHPLLPVLGALPFAPGVTAHSVIGRNDAVVPYASSHHAAAASETLVPAGHGLVEHPDAIAAVLRILAAP